MENMDNRTYELYKNALQTAKDQEERDKVMGEMVREFGATNEDVKWLDQKYNR